MLFSQIRAEPKLRAPFICRSPGNRGERRVFKARRALHLPWKAGLRRRSRCKGNGIRPAPWTQRRTRTFRNS